MAWIGAAAGAVLMSLVAWFGVAGWLRERKRRKGLASTAAEIAGAHVETIRELEDTRLENATASLSELHRHASDEVNNDSDSNSLADVLRADGAGSE